MQVKKFIEQEILREKNLKVMDMRGSSSKIAKLDFLKQQQFGRSKSFTFIANHVFLSHSTLTSYSAHSRLSLEVVVALSYQSIK